MIQPGIFNLLTAKRIAPPGMYLVDDEDTEVLLPNKYIPEDMLIDDEINVFIFYDSEDRMTATTMKPKIELHQFAGLTVKDVTPFGAFMDWGLEKDLLVPFSEQDRRMQRGATYLIYLYFDETTDRLVGTSKVSKHLERDHVDLKQGDEVELLLGDATDLGIKVIVNNKHDGLLYHSEIFKNLQLGERRKGYVKTVRDDGKIDVSLEKQGYQNVEPNAQKILDKLKANGGFLPLHDKSSPDMIQMHLEMSKKTFKKAVGALYREKVIRLEGKGIHLN